MTYGGTVSGTFSNIFNNGSPIPPSDLIYTGGSVEVVSSTIPFTGSGTWIGTDQHLEQFQRNWTDGVNNGVPGDGTRGPGVDTATFSGSGTVTAITLDINPNLAALSFSGANYTLSGGSLTLQQGTRHGHGHRDGHERLADDCQRRCRSPAEIWRSPCPTAASWGFPATSRMTAASGP